MSEESVKEVVNVLEASESAPESKQKGSIASSLRSEGKGSIEDLASQFGWNAEGEKSAEEYVSLALEKFPEQSKKIKQLFKAVDELKVHMSKTEQAAYERAKTELQQQRRAAISEGDVDLVEKIDEQIKATVEPLAASANGVHPAIADFEERNAGWLNGTSYEELKMQQWVEAHGAILGRKKLPVDEHMALLDEHVKKEFSSYFDQDDDAPIKSPVASSRNNVKTPSSGSKKSYTFNDLNEDQKKIAKDFQNLGIMSIDNYIKDLVKHGEL